MVEKQGEYIMKCNCESGKWHFDCTCEWTRKHPGKRHFSCEFCGMYDASKPRCNKCEDVTADLEANHENI
jgi:hypothetical protein